MHGTSLDYVGRNNNCLVPESKNLSYLLFYVILPSGKFCIPIPIAKFLKENTK
jgi:hypothetical protein